MYRTSIILDDVFAEEMKRVYDEEGYSINGRIRSLVKQDVEQLGVLKQ